MDLKLQNSMYFLYSNTATQRGVVIKALAYETKVSRFCPPVGIS